MRTCIIAAFLFLASWPLSALGRYNFFCQQGNQTIQVLGYQSSSATPVQASYPTCTVTVYINGSSGMKATIYSDNGSTMLSNPFQIGVSPETSTNGYGWFYAANGNYDIQFSGTGITSPFTIFSQPLVDSTTASSGTVTTFSISGPSWLTWTVTNATTTPAASAAPTIGQTSHQVIGTCNSATTFAPCALVAGDLPGSGATTVNGQTCTLGSTCTVSAEANDITVGTTTITSGTTGRVVYDNGGVVGEVAVSGTGSVCFTISCVMINANIGTPSAGVGTNFTGIPLNTAATSAALNRAHGGLNSTSAGVGILRDGATPTASELSGDAATSGSNAVTVSGVNNTPISGTNGHLASFGASNTFADSGIVAANVVAAGSAPTAAKQICTATSTAKTCSYIDLPDVRVIPAATCTNATATALWSIGASGVVTCRAGTNNTTAFIAITDTSSTFAEFQTTIPEDWDSATNPYIRFQIASTDTTVGHTIIPAIKVSCAVGNGSTTDDVTLNASHSLSTITLNSTANQFWSTSNIQMNSTDMTGCAAGALMLVQVGRATDTASQAAFYSSTITFPRLIAVQAN